MKTKEEYEAFLEDAIKYLKQHQATPIREEIINILRKAIKMYE